MSTGAAVSAARVFFCFALAYFLSYALRSVNAAIAPQLVADLALSQAQLGSLTSAYLLSFALMQWPLGALLDRYGARRVEAVLVALAALGCAWFASARDLDQLWGARALIGLGVSGCLMAALKGFRSVYAPDRQARMTLWMVMVGSVGAIAMTAPAQWLAAWLGWRQLFAGFALLTLLAAAVLWWGLPPAPEERVAGRAPAAQAAPALGYASFLRDPYFWRITSLGASFQGVFIAVQTLWLGPWLTLGLGQSPAQAAQWLLGFNVLLLLSLLALGGAAPRLEAGRRSMASVLLMSNGAMTLALWLAVAWPLALGPFAGFDASWAGPVSVLVWAVYAAASCFNLLGQSYIGSCYPPALAGRVTTSYNAIIFLVAFVTQWGLGGLADRFRADGDGPSMALGHALLSVHGVLLAIWLVVALWPARPRVWAAP